MGKHAKASRATVMIRTGACGGAALALSASGALATSPAFADGTPPNEVKSADHHKKAENKHDKKDVNKVNKHFEYTYNVEQGDDGDETHNTNGLLNTNDNNVQLILQACNNFVPVNVGGVQVTGEELLGALGLGTPATATGDADKLCRQLSAQQNGDNTVGDDDDGGKFAGTSKGKYKGKYKGKHTSNDDDGGGDETHNTNGLVNINDNDVQLPVQICNNYVPVNVGGVQVTGEELTGALGLFGEGTTSAEADNAKSCEQGQAQQDGDNSAGEGKGEDDGGDETHNTNGLVNLNDNNVQIPLQGCNNYVPVNVLGVQVTGEELTGALGLGLFGEGGGTSATSANNKECGQGSAQQDGDNSGDLEELAGLIGQQD